MLKDNNVLYEPPTSTETFKNMSVGELLFNQLQIYETQVAQIHVYNERKQTFKQILDMSKRLAIVLKEAGLKVEDRVAICSENNLEYSIVVCACIYLGATVCPLNPTYSERELHHALNISKPKYIFVSELAANTLQKVVKQLSWETKIMMINSTVDNLPNMNSLIEKVKDADANNFRPVKIDKDDNVIAIMCSSGTTGLPKGVMLTNKNISTVIRNLADPKSGFFSKHTIILQLLPFFHAYCFIVLLVGLILGAKGIVMPHFDEALFLYAIEKYKIETLPLVPPLMIFLAKHSLVNKYNLSSVKSIWCGAAPLSEEIQKAVAKRLNISNIKQGYGMTETTLAVTQNPATTNKYGSVGTVAPGMSVKVVPIDEFDSSKALGPNCKGELCFKGDLIMKGYYNNEEATKAVIDEDGWLHTGDIGYYDEDGYLYIVDRLKELIKYKGFQVPPAELEAIILTYPGVKETAVVGIPNEEAGELPLAFVVKDKQNITEEEIIKYVNDRVSSHKKLRGGVKFVHDIPKNPSGKILRRILRDMVKSKL